MKAWKQQMGLLVTAVLTSSPSDQFLPQYMYGGKWIGRYHELSKVLWTPTPGLLGPSEGIWYV